MLLFAFIFKYDFYVDIIGGIVAFEKKYADAYTELLVSETPPKWTGSSSLKSQGRKVYSLMELFSEVKLTVESFLEQFVKTGINMMDLSDDGKIF